MSPLALELVCHFLSGESGAWTAKDLKDLAAIQVTCKDARTLCARTSQQRKHAAQAHRAMMQDLHEYIDYKVNDARDMARDEGEEDWEDPFTGEVLPVYAAWQLQENQWFEKAEAAAARDWEEELTHP